jgi:hypothetical protein
LQELKLHPTKQYTQQILFPSFPVKLRNLPIFPNVSMKPRLYIPNGTLVQNVLTNVLDADLLLLAGPHDKEADTFKQIRIEG